MDHEYQLGGGYFSGKDSNSRLDRSVLHAKKNAMVDLLEERNASEVFVQLAYAIGYDKPLEASAIIDGEHESIKGYDLTPKGIIDFLELKTPIYSETAQYGHMGCNFKWR